MMRLPHPRFYLSGCLGVVLVLASGSVLPQPRHVRDSGLKNAFGVNFAQPESMEKLPNLPQETGAVTSTETPEKDTQLLYDSSAVITPSADASQQNPKLQGVHLRKFRGFSKAEAGAKKAAEDPITLLQNEVGMDDLKGLLETLAVLAKPKPSPEERWKKIYELSRSDTTEMDNDMQFMADPINMPTVAQRRRRSSHGDEDGTVEKTDGDVAKKRRRSRRKSRVSMRKSSRESSSRHSQTTKKPNSLKLHRKNANTGSSGSKNKGSSDVNNKENANDGAEKVSVTKEQNSKPDKQESNNGKEQHGGENDKSVDDNSHNKEGGESDDDDVLNDHNSDEGDEWSEDKWNEDEDDDDDGVENDDGKNEDGDDDDSDDDEDDDEYDNEEDGDKDEEEKDSDDHEGATIMLKPQRPKTLIDSQIKKLKKQYNLDDSIVMSPKALQLLTEIVEENEAKLVNSGNRRERRGGVDAQMVSPGEAKEFIKLLQREDPDQWLSRELRMIERESKKMRETLEELHRDGQKKRRNRFDLMLHEDTPRNDLHENEENADLSGYNGVNKNEIKNGQNNGLGRTKENKTRQKDKLLDFITENRDMESVLDDEANALKSNVRHRAHKKTAQSQRHGRKFHTKTENGTPSWIRSTKARSRFGRKRKAHARTTRSNDEKNAGNQKLGLGFQFDFGGFEKLIDENKETSNKDFLQRRDGFRKGPMLVRDLNNIRLETIYGDIKQDELNPTSEDDAFGIKDNTIKSEPNLVILESKNPNQPDGSSDKTGFPKISRVRQKAEDVFPVFEPQSSLRNKREVTDEHGRNFSKKEPHDVIYDTTQLASEILADLTHLTQLLQEIQANNSKTLKAMQEAVRINISANTNKTGQNSSDTGLEWAYFQDSLQKELSPMSADEEEIMTDAETDPVDPSKFISGTSFVHILKDLESLYFTPAPETRAPILDKAKEKNDSSKPSRNTRSLERTDSEATHSSAENAGPNPKHHDSKVSVSSIVNSTNTSLLHLSYAVQTVHFPNGGDSHNQNLNKMEPSGNTGRIPKRLVNPKPVGLKRGQTQEKKATKINDSSINPSRPNTGLSNAPLITKPSTPQQKLGVKGNLSGNEFQLPDMLHDVDEEHDAIRGGFDVMSDGITDKLVEYILSFPEPQGDNLKMTEEDLKLQEELKQLIGSFESPDSHYGMNTEQPESDVNGKVMTRLKDIPSAGADAKLKANQTTVGDIVSSTRRHKQENDGEIPGNLNQRLVDVGKEAAFIDGKGHNHIHPGDKLLNISSGTSVEGMDDSPGTTEEMQGWKTKNRSSGDEVNASNKVSPSSIRHRRSVVESNDVSSNDGLVDKLFDEASDHETDSAEESDLDRESDVEDPGNKDKSDRLETSNEDTNSKTSDSQKDDTKKTEKGDNLQDLLRQVKQSYVHGDLEYEEDARRADEDEVEDLTETPENEEEENIVNAILDNEGIKTSDHEDSSSNADGNENSDDLKSESKRDASNGATDSDAAKTVAIKQEKIPNHKVPRIQEDGSRLSKRNVQLNVEDVLDNQNQLDLLAEKDEMDEPLGKDGTSHNVDAVEDLYPDPDHELMKGMRDKDKLPIAQQLSLDVKLKALVPPSESPHHSKGEGRRGKDCADGEDCDHAITEDEKVKFTDADQVALDAKMKKMLPDPNKPWQDTDGEKDERDLDEALQSRLDDKDFAPRHGHILINGDDDDDDDDDDEDDDDSADVDLSYPVSDFDADVANGVL